MKLIFQAYKNADMTEGRGPMVPDIAFSSKQDAIDYIDRQSGIMGRKAKWSQEKYGDWVVKEITVFDSFEEADDFKQGETRRKILAKLTDAELKILGLER